MTQPVHLLAGAFALDALDTTERLAFLDHLHECAECRHQVAGLAETAALLSHVSAVAPMPRIRQHALVGITHLRPLPPVVPGTVPSAAHRPPVPTARLSPVRTRRARRRVALATAAAAAAVVAAVAAGAVPWSSAGDGPTGATAVHQVLHAPDRKHSSVESDSGWGATVWHSDRTHQAVLVTTNLPPAPDGMVYQAWLDQPSSGPVSAGLLSDEPDQSLLLTGDAATANGTRVTLEPDGGSSRPTSDPVAVFDFGQGA